MPPSITLEVCIASAEDALAAERGGADRLELNVALELGGLTPSVALFDEVKASVSIPVIVMIRPRAAGFCYSACERRLMMRDADALLSLGADGVASGALQEDGGIDVDFWQQLVELAEDRDVVFHRAFDVVESPETALQQLIDHDTTRVLTSGGRKTAAAGADQIARLRGLAGQRIEILPGSGVSSENVVELMRATQCDQVHGSFSELQRDAAGCVVDEMYPCTSKQRVAAVRCALDEMKS